MNRTWSLGGRSEMSDKTKFESIKELNMLIMNRLVAAEKQVRELKEELTEAKKEIERLKIGEVGDEKEEYTIEL
jgi:hypothetical protein